MSESSFEAAASLVKLASDKKRKPKLPVQKNPAKKSRLTIYLGGAQPDFEDIDKSDDEEEPCNMEDDIDHVQDKLEQIEELIGEVRDMLTEMFEGRE